MDVAVNQPQGVAMAERAGDHRHDPRHFERGVRGAADVVSEVLAVNELSCGKTLAEGLTDMIQGWNVRMMQCRMDTARVHEWLCVPPMTEDLERNCAGQRNSGEYGQPHTRSKGRRTPFRGRLHTTSQSVVRGDVPKRSIRHQGSAPVH